MSKCISDMYVNCSLQIRNFNATGVCASDCCGRFATSAVVMEDGRRMWRCDYHRGQRYGLDSPRGYTLGPVVYEIEEKEKEPMPLNDTEREILKREAENAYRVVQRTQRNLTEYEAEYKKAQEAHQAATAKWQSLSRHFDPVEVGVDDNDNGW